jgi:GxxExxY protein
MHADEEKINLISEKIIGCAYRVANKLGYGFLEKVYENALAHELRKAGLIVGQQFPIPVHYDGIIAGDFVADLLVENLVIVELKSVVQFAELHTAQCLNYLAATGLPLCLLINFGKRVDVKRYANTRKA